MNLQETLDHLKIIKDNYENYCDALRTEKKGQFYMCGCADVGNVGTIMILFVTVMGHENGQEI